MVVKILAWDYSGSTSGVTHYHTHGSSYLQKFSKENVEPGDKIFYLVWGTECEESNLQKVQEICQKKLGRGGGTIPSALINWITTNVRGQKIELWLITDGEIEQEELTRCAQLNLQVDYSMINFIVINKYRIGMSVGAGFFGGTQLHIYQDDQLTKSINTSVPFDYHVITLVNFDDKWNELSDFIQAKFMGSDLDGLKEADKLFNLRTRLLDELAAQNIANSKDTTKKLLSKKKSEIIEALKACTFYKTLTNTETKSLAAKIDGSISRLVNYIHSTEKSFHFASLKVEYKQDKMETVLPEPDPTLDNLTDAEICSFYDAITLEEETGAPILLLNITDMIEKYWVKKNYAKFRRVLDCPFFAQIDECIGHVYSIETFTLYKSSVYGELVNPLTNKPIVGGLIFSEKADKWNDYILTKSFFRGKKVKTNISLWYFVIWKHAENKDWIEQGVKNQLKSYAFRRLAKAEVKLALSSLPLDPQEIVPLPVACFYCTEGSSILFGQHPTLFLQERLRMFSSVAPFMLEILDHFGYEDIDTEFVKLRAKTFAMLGSLKRIPQEIEKRYFLLQSAFESKGKFLTYKVKDADALKYLNLLNYHHKDTMIPFDYASGEPVDFLPFVIISCGFESKYQVKICSLTFRPYFIVTHEGQEVPYYKQLKSCISLVGLTLQGEIVNLETSTFNLDHRKLLPLCKLYIELTKVQKKFPIIEEFSEYVLKVKRLNENKLIRLFPCNVLELIQEVHDWYSQLNADIDDFISKTRLSTDVEKRIQMEKELEGGSSDLQKIVADAKLVLANP